MTEAGLAVCPANKSTYRYLFRHANLLTRQTTRRPLPDFSGSKVNHQSNIFLTDVQIYAYLQDWASILYFVLVKKR